jgi:hypothetical protein
MSKPLLKPKSRQTSPWFAIGMFVMVFGIGGGPQGTWLILSGFLIAVFADTLGGKPSEPGGRDARYNQA